MPRRRCLEFRECGAFVTSGSRCALHRGRIKALRNEAAPIARAIIARSPKCVDCGATNDLTADHPDGAPLTRTRSNATFFAEGVTRCRSCNSRKGAN